MPEKNPQIDWKYWESCKDITSKQGALLAFGIDPNNIPSATLDIELHYQLKRFYRCLRLRSCSWSLKKLESEWKLFQVAAERSKEQQDWSDQLVTIALVIVKDNHSTGRVNQRDLMERLTCLLSELQYLASHDIRKITNTIAYNDSLTAENIVDTIIGSIIKTGKKDTCAGVDTDGFLPIPDAINLVLGKPADTPMNNGHPGWILCQDTMSSYWPGVDCEIKECSEAGIRYIHVGDFLQWAISAQDSLGLKIDTLKHLTDKHQEATTVQERQRIEGLIRRYEGVGIKLDANQIGDHRDKGDPLNDRKKKKSKRWGIDVALESAHKALKKGFGREPSFSEYIAYFRGGKDTTEFILSVGDDFIRWVDTKSKSHEISIVKLKEKVRNICK